MYHNYSIKIRNIKLEKGNVATDWTPAPEDVEAAIGEKANVTDLNTVADAVGVVSNGMVGKADEDG